MLFFLMKQEKDIEINKEIIRNRIVLGIHSRAAPFMTILGL